MRWPVSWLPLVFLLISGNTGQMGWDSQCVAAGAFVWMAACVKELQLSRILHMIRAFVGAHPMLRASGFALLKDVFLSSADVRIPWLPTCCFSCGRVVVFDVRTRMSTCRPLCRISDNPLLWSWLSG
jgi:hypothetical protein